MEEINVCEGIGNGGLYSAVINYVEMNDSRENIKKSVQENDHPEESLSPVEKHSCFQETSKTKFSEVPT